MKLGRIAVVNSLAFILVVLVGLIAYDIWHSGYYFYITNDAFVTASQFNIASLAPGIVQSINSQPGDSLVVGAPAATIRPLSSATQSIDILSPAAGTVVDQIVQPGAFVGAGQPIIQAIMPTSWMVTAYVDENHIEDIKVNQGVDIGIDALSDTTFHGHVKSVLPAAASAFSLIPTNNYASGNFTKVAQRIPVVISIDGTQGQRLQLGSSASITIHIHN